MRGARRIGSTLRVDTGKPVSFTFDGERYQGFAGDTLASALLANGVSLFGRSFKYHRPRGVVAAGIEEPNALVTILRDSRREPNIPATRVEIFDGLSAESQNCFPSLKYDFGALNGLAAPFFSAGFYYKTFMGPVAGPLRGTRFWMLCEKLIRRAAGLGRVDYQPANERYERINAFCEVLVVGSGPAGLAAARAAAESGKRVILCESDAVAGGSALWSDKEGAAEDTLSVAAELAEMKNVRLLTRTTVWGAYDGGTWAALQQVSDHRPAAPGEPRHRHWIIRAESTVLATGTTERPLVFPGNDRPGVMLAGAARRFALEFGVLPGARIAIFTNNDSAYEAAVRLHECGAAIPAIIDMRHEISEAARNLAGLCGAELLPAHAVVATAGRHQLRSLTVAPFDMSTGKATGAKQAIEADVLAMSGGWSPLINLASQAGTKPHWDEKLQAFLAGPPSPGIVIVGGAGGTISMEEALSEGGAAGRKLAGLPAKRKSRKTFDSASTVLDPSPAPRLQVKAPGKAFVDFQHDVTADDVRLAFREGFHSVEHLKRYTTLGMATDQGKLSNMPGLAIMADERGLSVPEVGTTRFRAPYAPVSLGSLAAERAGDLSPQRLTPMHDWHVENGARMMTAGLWYRPVSYAQAGETAMQACVREAKAVRERAGMIDVSTLGKIAVQGPDAGQFLDNVYTNMFSSLPSGKARYGAMLREDGVILDDGTTWRLSEDDFLMTTTTANAGKVMQHLEFLRDTSWPGLRVNLTSVTDQWAGLALAGPASRGILETCIEGTPVDHATLPPMGIVHGTIGGAPVMVCRLSFSGERAYEVYCPAGFGEHVWETVHAAGREFGIVTYGLDALDILRIEKGHVTGTELDGRTTIRDLHLDWMLSKKKPFVGSALMDREGLSGPHRLTLVGLISVDGQRFKGGAHIVENETLSEPATSIGHVTTGCFSPALNQYIGLALVESGNVRRGTRAFVSDPLRGHHAPVEIVSHHLFDPEGKRAND